MLVAGFWTSLIVVGAAALGYARRFNMLRGLAALVTQMPLAAQVFVAFGAAMVVFAPWIIIGYIFALPLKVLSVVYGLMILASLIYWWQQRRAVWARVCSIRPRASWLFALPVLLVMAMLADYAWALYIGAFIANGNDAYVHMAKIEQLAHGNMTLSDPYFSGVIESRYHLNFIHVFHAIGTQRLHMQTIDFWMYSYPFFRAMCWLGIFTLAWYFSPIRNRRLFAGSATLIAMAMLVNFFASANYPNVMVLSWIGLFIIGLSQFVQSKGGWLMLAGALLVGMTHPAYGVGTAGFLLLVGVYLVIFERAWLTKRRLGALVAGMGLLLWPAAIAALFPNRLSDQTFTFGTQVVKLSQDMLILKPNVPVMVSWSAIVLLLSLVGYIALIKTRPQRRDRVMVGLLVVYFALVAYNPLVSLLAGKQLPPWMIDRFHYVDRLSVIAALCGIIVVVRMVGAYLPRTSRRQATVIMTALLLVPVVATSVVSYKTYRASRIENRHEFIFMNSIEALEPALHSQRVFAMRGDSFILPAITTMSVISMPDTNASPVANMTKRQACSDYLAHTLDRDALATAGVTRVMVPAWEPELMQLARTKSYLKPLTGDANFVIFTFDSFKNHKMVGVCSIPHGQ